MKFLKLILASACSVLIINANTPNAYQKKAALPAEPTGYSSFKQEMRDQWEIDEKQTLCSRLFHLFGTLAAECKASSESARYLWHYNFIRELLEQEPACHVSYIDHDWVNEVEKEVRLYQFMEKERYMLPTPEQIQLLDQARIATGITEDISFAACPNPGSWTYIDGQDETKHYIALCATPEPPLQMFALYHELAHVLHRDSMHKVQIESGDKKPQDFIKEPLFASVLVQIKTFIALGKKAFDDSTVLGQKVNELLSKRTFLWFPPIDHNEYQKMVYFKGVEQRADLFACQKLLEAQQLDALLRHIRQLIGSNYIVAQGSKDTHPSDFERALYMTGFLVDKGININQAFNQLPEQAPGQRLCTSAPESPVVKSKGARDFLKAYYKWHTRWEKKCYEHWKQHVEERANIENIISPLEKIRCVASLARRLSTLARQEKQKANRPVTDYTRQAFYAHKYLLELSKMQPK